VSERDDAKLDHLLAEGRASGPTLDRVWARLDMSLDAEARAGRVRVPFWRRPFVALGASVGVALAAAVLVVVTKPLDDEQAAFAPRGASVASAHAPLLVASCGARDRACVVGEEIALSVADDARALTVEIALDDVDGERVLVPALAIAPGMNRVLPLVIVPDERDVERGLTIRWQTIDDDGRTSPSSPNESIHLHVEAR
jgi:hypothetical protein